MAESKTIDLSAAFPPQAPHEVLQTLADEAKNLYQDRDVYGSGKQLNEFEGFIAKLLGKEAGMFCITGVMAQMIALRLHARGRNRIVAYHPTSHLELHENHAYEHLLGFSRCLVGDAESVLTFKDVQTAVDAYWQKPSVLILELPMREIGGQCTPWEDLVKLREWTKERGIIMHLDGARIWEAQTYYRKSYADICALFDTVYVSFYKGIGALSGAMLLGAEDFIKDARVWLRRFGGNVFTVLPYAVSAEMNFRKHIDGFSSRLVRLKQAVTQVTIATQSDSRVSFSPSTPQVPMVHVWLRGTKAQLEAARDAVVKRHSIVVFDRLRSSRAVGTATEAWCFEWKMGPLNATLDMEVFRRGWTVFFDLMKVFPPFVAVAARPGSARPRTGAATRPATATKSRSKDGGLTIEDYGEEAEAI